MVVFYCHREFVYEIEVNNLALPAELWGISSCVVVGCVSSVKKKTTQKPNLKQPTHPTQNPIAVVWGFYRKEYVLLNCEKLVSLCPWLSPESLYGLRTSLRDWRSKRD